MKNILYIIALLISSNCFAQSIISYGVQKDTIGNYYIVTVIQSETKTGFETIQKVDKYPTKKEAVDAAWKLDADIKRIQTEVSTLLKSLIEN